MSETPQVSGLAKLEIAWLQGSGNNGQEEAQKVEYGK